MNHSAHTLNLPNFYFILLKLFSTGPIPFIAGVFLDHDICQVGIGVCTYLSYPHLDVLVSSSDTS